jgi:hypothetical protein
LSAALAVIDPLKTVSYFSPQSKAMKLEEAQNAKKCLEQEIEGAIFRFQEQTGLTVERVECGQRFTMGGSSVPLVAAEVRL